MSNEVFPVLPGVDIKVRRSLIPPPVKILTTPSQREYRARDATVPRYEYECTFNVLRSGAEAELQQVVGFFLRHGGAFDSFLIEDEHDYVVSGQQIGVGDGVTTQFQLVRSFGGFAEPVTAPKLAPAVFVNGQPANLLRNGSFEVNTLTALADGWVSYTAGSTGAVTYQQSGVSVFGALSQFVNASALGTASGDRVGVVRGDYSVVPGATYSLACSFMAAPGMEVGLELDFLNSGGGYISGVGNVWPYVGDVSGWHRPSVTAIAPAGAVSALTYIWGGKGNGGSRDVRFDGAMVSVGASSATYSNNVMTIGADGLITFASPPPAGHAITWSGEFYRRVRFQADQADFERFLKGLWAWRQVRMISVKG